MRSRTVAVPVVAGALVSTVLLLLPVPYVYVLLVGALVAGGISEVLSKFGPSVGAALGLGMIPGGFVVATLLAVSPPTFANSAAADLLRAMQGMGPRNTVFYAVFVYFIAVYTGLCGMLVGVGAAVTGRVSTTDTT